MLIHVLHGQVKTSFVKSCHLEELRPSGTGMLEWLEGGLDGMDKPKGQCLVKVVKDPNKPKSRMVN